MTSKEFKTFVSGLKGKWFWVLTPFIILGIIYVIYITTDAESDTEYVQGDTQEYFNKIPIRTAPPLNEYFLSIAKTTGVDFIPNIICDYRIFNLDTIPTQKAAIYFGVYAADIGYLSTYGKTQQALNYMDVCLELNKKIGGRNANNSDVLERFERNLSNPDSLNQFNNDAIKYLLKHDHRNLGLLVVFSAFIEAQYIAAQIIKVLPEDLLPDDSRLQVLSAFLNQKEFLRDLIDEFEYLEGKGEWEFATLNSLIELYHNYTKSMSPINPSPEPDPYERILLLSVQIDSLRANLVY